MNEKRSNCLGNYFWKCYDMVRLTDGRMDEWIALVTDHCLSPSLELVSQGSLGLIYWAQTRMNSQSDGTDRWMVFMPVARTWLKSNEVIDIILKTICCTWPIAILRRAEAFLFNNSSSNITISYKAKKICNRFLYPRIQSHIIHKKSNHRQCQKRASRLCGFSKLI